MTAIRSPSTTKCPGKSQRQWTSDTKPNRANSSIQQERGITINMYPEDDGTGKRGIERSRDTSEHRRCGIHNWQCHVHVPPPRSFSNKLPAPWICQPDSANQSDRSLDSRIQCGKQGPWRPVRGRTRGFSWTPFEFSRDINHCHYPPQSARESATNWTAWSARPSKGDSDLIGTCGKIQRENADNSTKPS